MGELLQQLAAQLSGQGRVRTGTYGVEGRFPFLDVKVVQAQLSIPPSLKKTYYKAAIQIYLKKYGYP